MPIVLTPNMNLPVPVVSQEPGPQYATDINGCMTILDQHNHSPGSGVQITPDGLNISADLPINIHNLTGVRAVRFNANGMPITPVAPDINEIFVAGVDLYYNDGNGNTIQITQAGGLAGTPGSISNLTPPASASYVSGNQTFVFQSNINTPANIDGASFIFRNVSAGSNGITVRAPNSLASNYSITWPALPGSNLPLSIDSAGTMSAAQITTAQIGNSQVTTLKVNDGAITKPKLAALGQQYGTGSGIGLSTTGTTQVDIAGDVTITVSGTRPVFVGLVQDSTTSTGAYIQTNNGEAFVIAFLDGAGSQFWSMGFGFQGPGGCKFGPTGFWLIDDAPTAGTHTYKIRIASVANSVEWKNIRIIAYEM